MRKIGFASDHAGFEMKELARHYAESLGYACRDFGAFTSERSDYPDYAHPLALAVEAGEVDLGIALCGSGLGISMTLNKHQSIRAALCWETDIARLARSHNDANILVLPARFITPDNMKSIVDAFLNTAFEGGRHLQRLQKMVVK